MPVSTSMKDYYAILGVTNTATDEDIKAAYKALALEWHPDRHTKNKEDAGRRFIELHEAYKFLTDKGRRSWYDKFAGRNEGKERGRPSSVPAKQQPSAGGGLESTPAPQRRKSASDRLQPLSKKYEDGRLKATSSVPPRPHSDTGIANSALGSAPPPQANLRPRAKSAGDSNGSAAEFLHPPSNSEKVANTNSKEPSLKTHNATIFDPSESDDISAQTAGMQLHTTTVITGGVPTEWIFPLPLTLEELYEGTAHRYRITRHLLSGKKKNVMVDIDVAPGWKKDTKIRFAGAGNERPEGIPQDVVFVVKELPHERFTREGSSLVTRVQISLYKALAGEGGLISFAGLDGKKIEVPLPHGVIKPGCESRLEGAGMPIRKQGKIVGRGDMIIRWEVIFPDKLTKKQTKELRGILES